MARKISEPIPPEPFQEWLLARIEYHQQRAEAEGRQYGITPAAGAVQRVCEEIGWEWTDTSARRLYRWRHGVTDSKVGGRHGKRVTIPRKVGLERGEVEDALQAAGVDFYELYPEFAHERDGGPEPEAWCPGCRDHVLVVHNAHEEPVCIWCDWKISDGHMNRGLVAA